MRLEVTPLYALPLVVMLFLLWLNVVKRRSATDVSIGFGDDTNLHENIRKHGHFIEFVPLVLVLMALAELRGGNVVALHVAGVLLVLSRVFHPFGVHHDRVNHAMRQVGNVGSLLALVVSAGIILSTYI